MKNLIGKRVRGFRFESMDKISYTRSMDNHIGEIGKISDYYSSDNTVSVQFKKESWLYPADLAKLHLVEDEFVLPEKWAIRPKNEKEGKSVLEWFNSNGRTRYSSGGENRYYWHFPAYDRTNHCLVDRIVNRDYKKITFEQFETHVLKGKKMENRLNVSKKDLEKIHAVACGTWKEKIIKFANRNTFGNEIELTQKEVDEMFIAATNSQRPVLVNIFGEPKKPIDFDRIKTGSKVMIGYSVQHCSGFHGIDETKPVDVVFFKSRSYITGEGKFNISADRILCTFHQDGKFVLFGADVQMDYITDVIKY